MNHRNDFSYARVFSFWFKGIRCLQLSPQKVVQLKKKRPANKLTFKREIAAENGTLWVEGGPWPEGDNPAKPSKSGKGSAKPRRMK